MLDKLNKIRNPDFSDGARKPRSWTWQPAGESAEWRYPEPDDNRSRRGIDILCRDDNDGGQWVQSFRSRKDQHYRVEAVVSCACDSQRHDGGLVLALHAFDDEGEWVDSVATVPLKRTESLTLRAFYKTPAGARKIELRIGLVTAGGQATIHDVRVIPIMEPEYRSHPWAVPPPPFAVPAPVRVRSVRVVTNQPQRRVIDLLRARFGRAAVTTCLPREFSPASTDADAVLFPDDRLPAKCATMRALKELAQSRIVIASLKCMEAVSDGQVQTRLIEQIDDPIHARLVHSDYISTGLALYDVFPFAERWDDSPRMAQRQFKPGKGLKAFCQRHGLETFLDSVTDSDATSERPIALVHRTERGAIIVMDIGPAEAIDSSLDDSAIAVRLLLSALGAPPPAVGQYIAPARSRQELLNHLRDTVERFPALTRSGTLAADEADSPSLITLGRATEGVASPLPPRPTILIRSGLGDEDGLAAYSVLLWLKNMLRPEPFICPYVNTLVRSFRVAWMPFCAPMRTWGGWAITDQRDEYPVELELEPGSTRACIDVVSTERPACTVVTPRDDSAHRTLANALPPILRQILTGRHLCRAPLRADRSAAGTTRAWRQEEPCCEVMTDSQRFGMPIHRSVEAAGGSLIRLELPGTHTEPYANSITRTDWGVLALENIVGLLLGVLVVNRDWEPLRFEWPEAVADLKPRAALRRINEPDQDLPVANDKRGTVRVPAGHALVAVR